MNFAQIAQAIEAVSKKKPQHIPALLYILLCSGKVEAALSTERVPSESELLSLVRSSKDTDPLGTVAELIAEFHEMTRAAQARASMTVLPIVE